MPKPCSNTVAWTGRSRSCACVARDRGAAASAPRRSASMPEDTFQDGASGSSPGARARAVLARSREQLRAARARARGQRRPEIVVYGLLLVALVGGIALDVGRMLGGVLFLGLLVPLHVAARRSARKTAPAPRKE